MTIDAAPPGTWAFVYPWCRVLRGKLHLEGRTAENSARWEYHWVTVRLPEKSDIISLRRIREALDLLARVAIVDNAAWRALLVQQCRIPRDEDDLPLDCALQPRFRFVFNEKFVEPGAMSPAAVCKQFFMTASDQRASDDYLEAIQSLAEVEASLKTRQVTPISFELQFELVTLPDDILEMHLRDLSAMLNILQVDGETLVQVGNKAASTLSLLGVKTVMNGNLQRCALHSDLRLTTTKSTVARALITAAQLTREDTLAIAVTIHSNSPPTVALDVVAREENMLNIRDWRRDNTGYFLEGTELTLGRRIMATPGLKDATDDAVEELTVIEREEMAEDYSVAATIGSSVDGESVKTEDFVGEEAFEEESSKAGEVDLAELAAADRAIESCAQQVETGVVTEMKSEDKELDPEAETTSEADANSTVDNMSEMGYSVAATLGSSVDADSVFSLDDMRDSTNGDVVSVEGETENKEGFSATAAETVVNEIERDATTQQVETKTTTETVTTVIEKTCTSSEVEISEDITTEASRDVSQIPAPPAVLDTEADEPEHEAEDSEKTPPKKLSSVISHFADKDTSKTGAHRTDSAAKLELKSPSPVQSLVHHLEVHEEAPLQTHRTPSAAKLDLSGGSPVKHAVSRLQAHQEEDNSLDNLKFRTKRDFFSKQRSISVSAEKEKYNARAKEEAEAKELLKSPAKRQSPVARKSSAMSSVRNMASRFEKKAEQSLDNLSFRTVRSFFPTEKSIHVGAEKQKYETLEKEKLAAKEAEEKLAKETEEKRAKRAAVEDAGKVHEQSSSKVVTTISTESEESVAAIEKFDEEETVSHSDSFSTPTKPVESATLKANRTRRHTTTEESPNVRGIAHRFETKRANSIVTAPVRTIDSFIVADSEASVRVSAEKAKYENKANTSTPVKRTIDSFIVADNEASVRVSAEKAKFENKANTSTPVKRTIDSFIVSDSEASVRVSAEKAKFENHANTSTPVKRTIDSFIVSDSEASVRVSAEKARFENQASMATPVKRTIDTFIVADNEASVRVSAEKAKFETPEKQTKATV
ncbi:Hypothetical protein PHPALM_7235, partial [Phytophthora palmivora]